MKITMLTYGSRGDIQPFLALGVGLQKAGHTITLAAPHCFSELVSSHNMRFAPLAGDPVEISKGLNDAGTNMYRMVKSMRDHVTGIAPQIVSQVMEACADADLLIHSFLFTTGGHSLARQLGIPDVSIQIFPMFAPTGDYPNVAFPPLGRAGNYFSHWLATQIFWHGGNSGFKSIQRLLPGSFPRRLHWPFDGPDPTPLLIACSPSVLPPAKNWPEYIHTTGYFFLEDESFRPAEILTNFLGTGSPPICVTFGSMVNRQTERMHKIIVEAILERNERAIIQAGWGGSTPVTGSRDVLYLESVPHTWLFPRCKAVIHHGGAGTTAAGLRAGIPNIVIPHAADQPFWGKRVEALGAGPAPIPVKKLTLEKLLAALSEVESPAIISAAKSVSRMIEAENGVEAAIRLIEGEKAGFTLKNANL